MSPLVRVSVRSACLAVLVVTLGACSFYTVVPRAAIKTVANFSIISTAMVMATDKTLSDHLVSYNTGKDCSTVRVEQGRTYCREDEPNPIANVHCYQTLGDVMCYTAPEPSRHPGDRIDSVQGSTL